MSISARKVGGGSVEVVIDGTEIRFARDGRYVEWMSDWARCEEFARDGYLNRLHEKAREYQVSLHRPEVVAAIGYLAC